MSENWERPNEADPAKASLMLHGGSETLDITRTAVGTEPDFSHIQTTAPDATADAQKLLQELRAHAEAIRMVAAITRKATVDYSHLWRSDAYAALPSSAKIALHRELGTAPPAPEPVPQSDESHVDQATPVAEQAGPPPVEERLPKRKPLKYRFLEYHVTQTDTGAVLNEAFDEYDAETQTYLRRTIPTDIPVPPSDQERYARVASELRTKLDARQVKIFFDQSKTVDDVLKPKWKYVLDGKTHEIHLCEHDIPDDIMELVKAAPRNYFRTAEWHRWFGPAMHAQREAIIARIMDARFVARPNLHEAPQEDSTPTDEEVARRLTVLVQKFAPLFDLPSDAKELVGLVSQFAGGVFRYRRERANLPTDAAFDDEELRMIRTSIRSHFHGDGAALDAVNAAFGEVTDSPNDADGDATAIALRNITDPRELERFIATQEQTAKGGDIKDREHARLLLLDIDLGRAGEASELRTDDIVHEGEARTLFESHPALHRRNIERCADGSITVHLDRLRPDNALDRALHAFMRDAAPHANDDHAKDATVSYFRRLCTATKESDEQAHHAFRTQVAALDRTSAELHVKDFERLRNAMKAIYDDIANTGS